MFKIISKKLYDEYTKTTINYHTDYSKITKNQLYDTFKFHCQGQRLLSEVVDYVYDSIQKDNKKYDLKEICERLNEIQYLLKFTYSKKKIRRKVIQVIDLLKKVEEK